MSSRTKKQKPRWYHRGRRLRQRSQPSRSLPVTRPTKERRAMPPKVKKELRGRPSLGHRSAERYEPPVARATKDRCPLSRGGEGGILVRAQRRGSGRPVRRSILRRGGPPPKSWPGLWTPWNGRAQPLPPPSKMPVLVDDSGRRGRSAAGPPPMISRGRQDGKCTTSRRRQRGSSGRRRWEGFHRRQAPFRRGGVKRRIRGER